MARTRCFCYHFAVAVSFGLSFSKQQTSTMVRPTTETLSATVRNKFRRTAALKSLAYVFTKRSMKKADMEHIMFECYHGNKGKDIASHVSMIARDESGYSELYDNIGVHITDSVTPSCAASATSSTSSGTGGKKLVLKSALIPTGVPRTLG